LETELAFGEVSFGDSICRHSSSASVFDNPVSQLVCDALVAYYSYYSILQAIYDFDNRSQEFRARRYSQTYSPSFLILLVACYSGDIIFLQQALNDERIFRENTSYDTLVSSCLRIVAQQGHPHVMEYLLDTGFDVNHIGTDYLSAIVPAARGGNRHLLEMLLRPAYGLKRSGDQYTFALYVRLITMTPPYDSRTSKHCIWPQRSCLSPELEKIYCSEPAVVMIWR
jgi:hypothetical protein